MPHHIGPELRLARPKTHHGFSAAKASDDSRPRTSSSNGARNRNGTQQPDTSAQNEQQIELLEYEWPDLPPMMHLKDAVCRRRVSQGINYLLPVDKGKNSIDSKFRTDLRAMFQEPYTTEGANYDDNRVTTSAKVHFQTNVVDTRWTKRLLRRVPVNLNCDSENVRKLYAHSAPVGGRTRPGTQGEKMKTRSSLFLPIKTKAHPEAQKLRKEVEKIIKSVQEDNDEYNEDQDDVSSQTHADKSEKIEKRKSLMSFRASVCDTPFDDVTLDSNQSKRTAEQFDTYEQLKKTKPPKPKIPVQFISEYLSIERNQEIWDWLHYGETITDFEYFLAVCG
ncbi:hypothetical protein ACF0H5_008905 [Mactra antiquata]